MIWDIDWHCGWIIVEIAEPLRFELYKDVQVD